MPSLRACKWWKGRHPEGMEHAMPPMKSGVSKRKADQPRQGLNALTSAPSFALSEDHSKSLTSKRLTSNRLKMPSLRACKWWKGRHPEKDGTCNAPDEIGGIQKKSRPTPKGLNALTSAPSFALSADGSKSLPSENAIPSGFQACL